MCSAGFVKPWLNISLFLKFTQKTLKKAFIFKSTYLFYAFNLKE